MNKLHIGLRLVYPTDLEPDDTERALGEIDRLGVVERLTVAFPGALVELDTPEVSGPSAGTSTPLHPAPGYQS